MHADGAHMRKRSVRMEVIGKMFVLYENQWRSEGYRFDQLTYEGADGSAQLYGLEQGEEKRPGWRLLLSGDVPEQIAAKLPKPIQPALSNGGMLAIAFLCLAIVYNSTKLI